MEHVATLYHLRGWWKWISSSGVLMKRKPSHISWKAEVFWIWNLCIWRLESVSLFWIGIFYDSLFVFTPQRPNCFLVFRFVCVCLWLWKGGEWHIFTVAIEISQAFCIGNHFQCNSLLLLFVIHKFQIPNMNCEWNLLNDDDNDKICIIIYYWQRVKCHSCHLHESKSTHFVNSIYWLNKIPFVRN